MRAFAHRKRQLRRLFSHVLVTNPTTSQRLSA
jgi:hypothetical protein